MKIRILACFFVTATLLAGCHGPVLSTEPSSEPASAITEIEPTQYVTELPTVPETEPVTEEATSAVVLDDVFVRVCDYVPNVRVELAYATENNFTRTPIYEFTDAYLRYGTVLKLEKAAAILVEHGCGVVIWDAYRPVAAQERLWEICPDPTYVSKPGSGSQSHCRGIAVDITLYDLQTGELLEIPTAFDDFSSQADRDYGDCTQAAAEHARMLESVMTECGFKPYYGEWWHYADTQDFDVEYEFSPD